MKKRLIQVMVCISLLALTGCTNPFSELGSTTNYSKYVKLGEYKGIEYVKDVEEVTEQDIQDEIDYFLEENSIETEITNRGVLTDDIVNIDFVGKMGGEPFENGSGENYDLEIGSHSFLEGFEEGLVHKNIGETVELELAFPKDYHEEDLAGKEVTFEVTINSITTNTIPKLTDELVKEKTEEYETVAEYKASIRQELEQQAEEDAENDARNYVFEQAIENAEVTGYPQDEIDKLVDEEFNNFKETAEYYQEYGYSYEDVLGMNGYTNEEELKGGITEYVRSYMDQKMTLYAIAKAENIKVTDEEIDAIIQDYMDMYGVEDRNEIIDYFGFEYFEISPLSEKVMAFLMEHAVLVDSLPEMEGDEGLEFDLEDLEGFELEFDDDELDLEEE